MTGAPYSPDGHAPDEHRPGEGDSPEEHDESHRGAGAAKAVGRGAAATARGLGRFSRFAYSTAQRAADAQGAAESGLNRLIWMHAFNDAGDAAVAISLAGSLFFSMPSASGGGSSREHVALFLGLTMLPFAIVAPVLGPLLDRVSGGRRWAIGATMAARAFLCWVLAGALPHQSLAMFPAALGVLVASKAYGVTRAAAVPRLLPQGFTLVRANGRVSLAGTVGVLVLGSVALLLHLAGAEWTLRWAALLFICATVGAVRLPSTIDSAHGEGSLTWSGPREGVRRGRLQMRMPASVAFGIRANCGPNFLYGFLLLFMAFLLQEHPIDGWNSTVLLGVVAGGAGVGNFAGIAAAAMLRRLSPRFTISAVLVLDAAAVLVCALFYGIAALALIGLVAGLGKALAKFALDSTIQRDVPAVVQTSAFARSDTTLQLAWVIGGFVGIALPLHAELGLWVVFGVLTIWAITTLAQRPASA